MTLEIDLFVDLNTEDDTGLPWTFIDEARDPSRIVPGRYVVVGAGSAVAVAQIVDIAADGVVHVRPLPGPVSANAHQLSDRGAA
jgi:hypothetical protein